MKKHYILFIILVTIASFSMKAQTLKTEITQIKFDGKERSCIEAKVDPEPKPLKKSWAKYLKKNYDIKLKGIGWFSNKDLLKAEDVIMKPVFEKRMNLYTEIIESGNGSVMKVFASYGYDIFIDQANYPKEFEELKTILNHFLMEHLNDYYTDEVKATTKRIKSLSKEKKSLLRSIEKNNKKIKNASEEIAEQNTMTKSSNEELMKSAENTAKLSNLKLELEKKNQQSTLNIKEIDEKLIQKRAKLERLQLKFKNLNKN